jgi:hypothetical protein
LPQKHQRAGLHGAEPQRLVQHLTGTFELDLGCSRGGG